MSSDATQYEMVSISGALSLCPKPVAGLLNVMRHVRLYMQADWAWTCLTSEQGAHKLMARALSSLVCFGFCALSWVLCTGLHQPPFTERSAPTLQRVTAILSAATLRSSILLAEVWREAHPQAGECANSLRCQLRVRI